MRRRPKLLHRAVTALATALIVAALAGCYKLEEGVGDLGFAPMRPTSIIVNPGPPDNRQPDITTQQSMADRATSESLSRGTAAQQTPSQGGAATD